MNEFQPKPKPLPQDEQTIFNIDADISDAELLAEAAIGRDPGRDPSKTSLVTPEDQRLEHDPYKI